MSSGGIDWHSEDPGWSSAGIWGTRQKGRGALRKAFLDLDIDTEGAIVVAEGDDGDVAVDVVFDLNHLFLRRAHVGDVSDGHVACDALLHGDARGGVLVG